MILPFSQHFDKQKQKSTYFAEKIWKTIDFYKIVSENECIEYSNSKTRLLNLAYSKIETFIPKIHTIRADLKNRWKQGNKIHPVFNNRSKNQFQFAPTFLCKAIQRIEIKYNHGKAFVTIYDKQSPSIWIHDFKSDSVHPDILKVAINDGFENISDFFSWFKSDFTGKIIHFTDFRY